MRDVVTKMCCLSLARRKPRISPVLTHWGRDKMATISWTTLSDAFPWIKNVRILIEFSLKFVPKVRIINITALVQIMAWPQAGNKLLSETMMDRLPTHICFTRPQWVICAMRISILVKHIRIFIGKIRWSQDCLISTIGIHMLLKQHLYIETTHRFYQSKIAKYWLVEELQKSQQHFNSLLSALMGEA